MKKIVLIIAGIVIILGIAGAWVFQGRTQGENRDVSATVPVQTSESHATQAPKDGPPLLMKHLGIELGAYDKTTNKAGDMVFSPQKLSEFDMPFYDFGYAMPANSASPAKRNPQPTYVVPLGTKVHAIVDGIVVDIPKLYSNDYSIMVAKSANATYIYEMEHVINPLVKVGDRVKAGDIIAEVSDYDSKNTPGYGILEIGILKGGNPPSHVCPFPYLDPSIKETVFANLKSIYQGWNDYRGKAVYDLSAYETPGCLSYDEVEG